MDVLSIKKQWNQVLFNLVTFFEGTIFFVEIIVLRGPNSKCFEIMLNAEENSSEDETQKGAREVKKVQNLALKRMPQCHPMDNRNDRDIQH